MDFVVGETDGSTVLGRIVLVGVHNPRMFTLVAGPGELPEAKAAYDRLLKTFTPGA